MSVGCAVPIRQGCCGEEIQPRQRSGEDASFSVVSASYIVVNYGEDSRAKMSGFSVTSRQKSDMEPYLLS